MRISKAIWRTGDITCVQARKREYALAGQQEATNHPMFKSILVLESPWDNESVNSPSVWPMVREFASARGLKAFHQTFFDKSSFQHWVQAYNSEPISGPKLLYVAAHGDNGRLCGLKKDINRSTIISTLVDSKNIKFVHFGSCLFGSQKNLQELLTEAEHLSWAAGYNERVDWIDSTLFDILFWGRIESRYGETRGRRTHTLVSDLLKQVHGLADQLGFRLQYRYGDAIKSVST